VTLLCLYGSLFFAGARALEADLPAVAGTRNGVLILSLRGHGVLGSTFLNALTRYAAALRAGGNTLLLTGVEPPARAQLDRTGLLPELGAANVFGSDGVSASMRAAVARARQLLRPE
jgi:SulP family sulfate permease